MAELAFPFLTLGLAAPAAAAALLTGHKSGGFSRAAGIAGAAISTLCGLEVLREVAAARYSSLHEPWALTKSLLFVDGLSAAPLALFPAVVLGLLILLPRKDASAAAIRAFLVILAASFAAYTAENLILFVLAWLVSFLPILKGAAEVPQEESLRPKSRLPLLVLSVSTLSLTAGVALMIAAQAGGPSGAFSMIPKADSPGGIWAFGLLMLAVLLRKGIFPFHSWVLGSFSRGPLLLSVLLLNSHMGAYLVARLAIPAFPVIAGSALSFLGDLAMLTAVYAAVVALAEHNPRRLIALLAISQASFILLGLETATAEGATGGLVYWMVVTVATTSIAAVYRLLEARVGHHLTGRESLGLGAQFPRLAAFFLISGLALVGLPGTLGFFADELLLHGALESHPLLGLALPIATALNAFHLFRLFSRLFLGSRGLSMPGIPDALPRERWALICGLLFLIGGGLLPGQVVALRADAAEAIAAAAKPANELVSSLWR